MHIDSNIIMKYIAAKSGVFLFKYFPVIECSLGFGYYRRALHDLTAQLIPWKFWVL